MAEHCGFVNKQQRTGGPGNTAMGPDEGRILLEVMSWLRKPLEFFSQKSLNASCSAYVGRNSAVIINMKDDS